MGTQVAARTPQSPGLMYGSNLQGPGSNPRRNRERDQTFLSAGSMNSSTRDCHLRIQGHRYSLSKSVVSVSAKIHTKKYSLSHDDKIKCHHSQASSVRSPHFRDSYSREEKCLLRTPEFQSTCSDQNLSDISSKLQGSCHLYDGMQRPLIKLPLQLYTKHCDNKLSWSSILDDRRGLSRVTLEEHPTHTLEIVDHQTLPQEFSHKIVEAITSYRETPTESNCSSPTITEEEIASSSPSIIQEDIFGTGNTTERSSVDSQYSWDEFDRQAAKTVQNLFDEIDSTLFERRTHQTENIFKECQEWGFLFPHLRILGRQLLPVQEMGYEIIERDLRRPNTSSSIGLLDITEQDYSQDSQGLSVCGHQVHAIVPPVEAHSRNSGTTSTSSTKFSFLEEEVFDCEGDYEEIIAVDYKDIYEDHHENKKQLTPRRRHVAYPPITPNACFKDSVISSAFDCMWQEVISWIRPLLKKYSDLVLELNKPTSQSLQMIHHHNESTQGPLSRENTQLPNFLGMRAQTMIENRAFDSPKLDGVLQISRKIPVQRETSQLTMDVTASRPTSSILPGTRNLHIGRLGGRGRGIRLMPIHNNADRSKTPSVDEERVPIHPASGALLVRKINLPGTIRLSSPPYNARNGALPPINSVMEIESSLRLQKKIISSRASSAIDKEFRVVFKDRTVNYQDARPSTTHAFRSETPQGIARRSSTPFNSVAFNNPPTSRNSNFGNGSMHLGIHGNGLQMAHDIAQLANIPQEILEDPEGLEDTVHQNHWSHSTPSHNNPYYRRSRHNSSLVRL